MSFTTPPRPVDVTAVFPHLAPLVRTTTRLYPRPGSPSPRDSSVGGPLLWPTDEPWPYFDGPHVPDGYPATSPQDVRLQRRIRAAVASRPPGHPRFTPEEAAILERINTGRPWPKSPVAMLPVAQLYVLDIPLLLPPGQTDLLQALWCPFDHLPEPKPRTALFWWSATDVAPDGSYEPAPEEFYQNVLPIAPGWKVGGWTRWGLADPVPRICPTCNTGMNPLLTIASTEWDASTHSWIPYEEQTHATPSTINPHPAAPAMVELAGGYDLQLYACPESPDHPHTALIQWGFLYADHCWPGPAPFTERFNTVSV
ncbi:hypothetical protein [Streptomyces morookaense]|uniref:hypothetical protein n=1 Tax=Streptomyces morookaense TaxID=1970 RepID=UPI0019CC2AE5|nr:hypothetical protein [Streptomyces morookaense]GHF05199.1 hypothetical protein GCM10010359_02710 [Streptomyces morookaense]